MAFTVYVRAPGHVGKRVRCEYVRHLRTLTHGEPGRLIHGTGNADVDLVRAVKTGVEFEAQSDAGDARQDTVALVDEETARRLKMRPLAAAGR